MKYIKFLVMFIMTGILLSGCGSVDANTTSISVNGSSSVSELFESRSGVAGFIDVYEEEHADIAIKLSASGSSDGIKAAKEGLADIGMSSRKLKAEEKPGLERVVIALDAIAVVVNPENPINNLTVEQLSDIYTGKITNWSEVGGEDMPIALIARESGSGTRGAFEELLSIKDKMSETANEFNGTGGIKAEVTQNKNAIGYISLGAVDDNLKAVEIDGVYPSTETVKDGSYALQRPFILVYRDDVISDEARDFIDWILSDEGQQIVENKKFITIN